MVFGHHNVKSSQEAEASSIIEKHKNTRSCDKSGSTAFLLTKQAQSRSWGKSVGDGVVVVHLPHQFEARENNLSPKQAHAIQSISINVSMRDYL